MEAQISNLSDSNLELVEDFRIEMPTPSLNQILRWQRKTPWKYGRLKKSLFDWVMVMVNQLRIPKADGRRHIHIMRTYRSERYRLDDDNLRGGCKPLVDALVHYGVIIDDSDEHADITYDQSKQTSGEDWVEIEVYDIV